MDVGDIRMVGVVGAGTMGHGITWTCAKAGYKVNMVDVKEECIQAAINKIRHISRLFVENQLMSAEEAEKALARIQTKTDLAEGAKDVDFLFEAVTQNLDIKKKVYKELDKLSPEHAIFATIQSRISPTELAQVTKRPDKIIAAAHINPPYLLPAVEIIPGNETSDETINITKEFMIKIGKAPVICKEPVSIGFIQGRLINALVAEALSLVESGVASPTEIDTAFTNGYGMLKWLYGILEGLDHAGLDTYLGSFNYVFKISGDHRYRPYEVLKRKVEAGELGVKTGKGFYDYRGKSMEEILRARDNALIKILKLKSEQPL